MKRGTGLYADCVPLTTGADAADVPANIAQPGHNGGPTLEAGFAWRRHCWTTARAALLPTLPIEVLRLRLKRAADLGLDYRTYASVRAASGHDVVAILFSSNALRVVRGGAMPPDRIARLDGLRGVQALGLATAPLAPDRLLHAASGTLHASTPAPPALAAFRAIAADLRLALGRLPGDRAILVGDLALERDWCAAGRLAFYLPAERFFAAG